MSSTKKVEGIVFHDNFVGPSPKIILWQEGSIDQSAKQATLVIHPGPREEVWTASEVKAMVAEMVEGVTAGEELTLETIAAKHGITL